MSYRILGVEHLTIEVDSIVELEAALRLLLPPLIVQTAGVDLKGLMLDETTGIPTFRTK